jgi:hypothetical protein
MAYPAGIKIAKWAKAEQRKQARKENRGQTRNTFGFLFGLAVLVFVYSDHSAFQNYLYAKLSPLLASLNNASEIKFTALRHEQEINNIAH